MEKYQSYKSSSVEWIGEIPNSWEETRLKYLGNLYGGLTGKSGEDFKQDDNPKNKPYIPYTNIFRNTYISKNHVDYVVLEDGENQNKVKKFDLFFLMSSETYQDLGKPCILIDDIEELYLNSFCKGFRVTRIDVNPLFLNYQLLGSIHKELISIEGRGFTRINLRQDRLNETPIFLPPLQEQLQIVQFLDEKTELIDKLISTKERKITLLKEQRTSLINEVVTKGLNPNVKMKNSGVEWIGEIPEGWVVSKFKYVSDIVTGNTPSKTDGGDYYSDEGFLWIKPTYLKGDKYVNDSDEKLTELGKNQTRVIPKDSIMICCIGNTIGKYGMSEQEVSTNQQINSVIPNKSKITPWYCLYFVDVFTRDLLNRSNFVTLPILTKSDLENIEIILPTLEEQVCIVENIKSKTKEINDLVQLEKTKIDLLKEYRQSLISEVVTGKIKVTTDE